MTKRIVIVPSIAGSMLPPHEITLAIQPATPEQLQAEAQQSEVINYIRHPATNQLLQRLIPHMKQAPNPEYKILQGDIIYIVSLSQRAPQSGMEVNVQSFEQLVIYRVTVISQ